VKTVSDKVVRHLLT